MAYLQKFSLEEMRQVFRPYGYDLLPEELQIKFDDMIHMYQSLYQLRTDIIQARNAEEIFKEIPKDIQEKMKKADKSDTHDIYVGYNDYPRPMPLLF